jgi:hypothetical protein
MPGTWASGLAMPNQADLRHFPTSECQDVLVFAMDSPYFSIE